MDYEAQVARIRIAVREDRHSDAELIAARILGNLGLASIIDPTRIGLLKVAEAEAEKEREAEIEDRCQAHAASFEN